MTSTDAGRYQLYSRQGVLGSLMSLDAERAQVHQTAQRATAAAQALIDLQREWGELQEAAERLLTKGRRSSSRVSRSIAAPSVIGRSTRAPTGTKPRRRSTRWGRTNAAPYQVSAGFRTASSRSG
jgi:hypothetical protein